MSAVSSSARRADLRSALCLSPERKQIVGMVRYWSSALPVACPSLCDAWRRGLSGGRTRLPGLIASSEDGTRARTECLAATRHQRGNATDRPPPRQCQWSASACRRSVLVFRAPSAKSRWVGLPSQTVVCGPASPSRTSSHVAPPRAGPAPWPQAHRRSTGRSALPHAACGRTGPRQWAAKWPVRTARH